MSQVEAIFSDYDGTLINSKVICPRTYAVMLREFGVRVDLKKIFTRLKGVELYEIVDIISKEQDVTMIQADAEHIYHAEVARLFDTELEDITGTNELLASVNVPIRVASNGPVNKMQHLLGKLNMLHYFPEKLFSGYDIQRWEPDPALIFHATEAMNVNVENCILVDDSSASAQSEINAGMEVLYFCTDPHSRPIAHPKVITFTRLLQLPGLWEVRG